MSFGHIDARHLRHHISAEARTPAVVDRHGGIAHQNDPDGRQLQPPGGWQESRQPTMGIPYYHNEVIVVAVAETVQLR